MPDKTTMRSEINALVTGLARAGIPVEAIADELLIAAAGILIMGRDHESAAQQFELRAQRIREHAKKRKH